MGEHQYVEIPGSKTHELPPLLLHNTGGPATDLDAVMLEAEDMLAATDAGQEVVEQRKFDLARPVDGTVPGSGLTVELGRQCDRVDPPM